MRRRYRRVCDYAVSALRPDRGGNQGGRATRVPEKLSSIQTAPSTVPYKSSSLAFWQIKRELHLLRAILSISSLKSTPITSKYELLKTFKKVSLFLEKDKLFIFDVNTVYKHKNILANNAFCFDKEDYFAVWQNETKNNKTEIFIDIFKKNGENYTRYSESFFERAYTDDEIKDFAKKSGFVVLDVFDDLTFLKPNEKSERLYYILKKI